ncbi:hypothetical protein BC828DRAFT_402012 [Blastocladiella britannica]|nr:hypothetical protein BC828DRAFT_402012 [Blastocladiella britannica]
MVLGLTASAAACAHYCLATVLLHTPASTNDAWHFLYYRHFPVHHRRRMSAVHLLLSWGLANFARLSRRRSAVPPPARPSWSVLPRLTLSTWLHMEGVHAMGLVVLYVLHHRQHDGNAEEIDDEGDPAARATARKIVRRLKRDDNVEVVDHDACLICLGTAAAVSTAAEDADCGSDPPPVPPEMLASQCPAHHAFHRTCLERYVTFSLTTGHSRTGNVRCPTCRAPLVRGGTGTTRKPSGWVPAIFSWDRVHKWIRARIRAWKRFVAAIGRRERWWVAGSAYIHDSPAAMARGAVSGMCAALAIRHFRATQRRSAAALGE